MQSIANHLDNEVVLTMSETDLDILREMWMFAVENNPKNRDRYLGAINRICHTAETLTLSWLDRKLEEFP